MLHCPPVQRPWEKGNSWLIGVGLAPTIAVVPVYYTDGHTEELLNVGLTPTFVVTKV